MKTMQTCKLYTQKMLSLAVDSETGDIRFLRTYYNKGRVQERFYMALKMYLYTRSRVFDYQRLMIEQNIIWSMREYEI